MKNTNIAKVIKATLAVATALAIPTITAYSVEMEARRTRKFMYIENINNMIRCEKLPSKLDTHIFVNRFRKKFTPAQVNVIERVNAINAQIGRGEMPYKLDHQLFECIW